MMKSLLSETLFMAYRQLHHRMRAALGMLAGVCVAIILMFMQLGFRNALYDSAIQIPEAVEADLFVTSTLYESLAVTPPWVSRAALNQARSVPGVADVRSLYAFVAELSSPRNGYKMSAWILAFDPKRPVFRNDEINRNIDLLKLPNNALMDRLSRYEYEPIVQNISEGRGQKIAIPLSGSTLSPVMNVEGLFSLGPSFFVDGLVITSDINFYRWMGVPLDRVSLGLVTLAPGANPVAVKKAIANAIQGNAKVFDRDEYMEAEREYYATKTPIGMIFNLGLAVGVVVGIVFITQVLNGIIDANLREYAVLMTMGYELIFFGMIIFEISLFVSVVTFLPSMVFSTALYHLAAGATALPLSMTLGSACGVFGAVLLMGALASLLAMRKMRNANPLDLFS
jgi:putative ABC transport system permease protein